MEFAKDIPMLWVALLVVGFFVAHAIRGKKKGNDNEPNGEELDLLGLVNRWNLDELFGGFLKSTISGDRSGVKAEIKNTVAQLLEEPKALDAMKANFYTQLPRRLDDPQELARISRIVDERRESRKREAQGAV